MPDQTDVVEQEIRIAASPEAVFDFLVDPEKMVRWKGRAAELDPRPGGIYRVDINDKAVARGEYVELDAPHRVVFTWGWEGSSNAVPPGSSRVEIDLIPDGEDTIVRLRHLDLPASERPSHRQGWEHYLTRLEQAATGRDPGADPHASEASGAPN